MSTPLRRRALSRSASISRNNPLLELVEQAGYQRTDPMLWRVLRLSLKRLNSNQWRNLQDRSNRRDNGKLQEQLKEMVNDLADFRSAEADRAAGEVEAFEEDSSDEDPANVAFHAVEDRVEEIKKLLSSKLADDWKHVWDREATILGLHLDPYAAHDLYNHPMKYEQIKLRHAIRDLALKDTDPVTCHVLVHALQHVQQSLSSYIVLHRERDHPGHARHPPIKELEERLQALHRELGEYRQHPAGLRDLIDSHVQSIRHLMDTIEDPEDSQWRRDWDAAAHAQHLDQNSHYPHALWFYGSDTALHSLSHPSNPYHPLSRRACV